MTLKTLAWLVFQANSGPPNKKFYEIKDAILRKFGTMEGFDIQEIEGKKCFTCCGQGNYWGNDCYDCDGSGFYKDPFKSVLEKRSLTGYHFHLPVKKLPFDLDIPISIKGYIHKEEQEFCREAREILELLFDNNLHLKVEEFDSMPF